jgi:hypothetical protein
VFFPIPQMMSTQHVPHSAQSLGSMDQCWIHSI